MRKEVPDTLECSGAYRDYTIRDMKKSEYPRLHTFLYEAIFVPEGAKAPPKSCIHLPEMQVYTADFGKKKDDYAIVAEISGKIVGAAWVRMMNDYGHVDDETPSLAISLYKEYRGMGIGTALMKRLLFVLKEKGYQRTSLAVQKANYALKMYLAVGYKIVDENKEEYIMVNDLQRETAVCSPLPEI